MTPAPPPPTGERLISYDELKQHSSYADAWISLNGIVYDVTRFIPRHPFGDTFRGHLGTECGGLFSSVHLNTDVESWIRDPVFLQKLQIKVVGRLDVSGDHLGRTSDHRYLDRIVYKNTDEDPFWLDLKAAVRSYLREHGQTTHYSSRDGLLYLVYYFSIELILSYLAWVQGAYWAAALLGFHMVCASANVAHMATHAGFTRNRWLNFLAMQIFDLCGMSSLEWQIAHQTHHNQPHSSIDHQTNSYDRLGVRIHKYMRYRSHHRFQHLYFWLVISSYLLFRLIATTIWMFTNREFVRHRYELAAHLIARLVLLGSVILSAFLNGVWTAAALFAVYAVVCSQTAFILLYNNFEDTHKLLGEREDVAHYHEKLSWAEVQVRTSSNWYPTNWFLSFVEFHYGYFNYHIEHHLFPALKPILLKQISPVVRAVCEKHGVPYISTPFLTVQRSLQSHLTNLGRA
jgi:linoleoyl-CoA desaturase